MEYSHNLKIILVDINNNIIEDKIVLDEIKSILSKNNTHKIEWIEKLLDITIKWDKIILNVINQALMGDLFSNPIYEADFIILNHTQKTMETLTCKYIVKFYLSKILYKRIINKDSVGFV